MEKLRESWTFGSGDFQSRCSKLEESVYTTKYKVVKRLDESCDTNEVIKLGLKLKESLSGDNAQVELLDKILEALQTNGADNTFKVWRIPVAKYDHKNLNGRIYPKALWENINNNQKDAWCGLCGLADHPEADNDPGKFRDQAVVWHGMDIGQDGVVYGICSFVGPYGHLAQEILEHGGRVGTSSSGFGDVDPITKIVNPDTYQVERLADLVLNPSQGTYGCSADTHVSPSDFTKDLNSAAVIEFNGNKPITESIENTNQVQPRSKIFMAKANAVQPTAMATENGATKVVENTNNKMLSKVEEKAFRQYVEKFLNEAKNFDNPLKRLNECTDILACFEEGNCVDLREAVEAQIIAEKENLEKIVENTTNIEKEFGMTAEQLKEAAVRSTSQAILLNEQVTDYKALLEEATKRNAAYKEEIDSLTAKLENQTKITESKIKMTNRNVVESLQENDKLKEDFATLKTKNHNLMERISQLSLSNSKFEKDNGVLETKLKEAAEIIKSNKKLKENVDADVNSLKDSYKSLLEKYDNKCKEFDMLQEAYDAQSRKFDKLENDFATYKEKVTDAMDPTKHVMERAETRIGKYLDMRENGGVEIEEYWQDLKENYGDAVAKYEDEIRGAKTLREATSRFMRHRNEVFKEFENTSAIDQVFRNKEERSKIYESVGMLNPEKSYADASIEEKNAEFLKHQEAQGLY